YAEGCRKLGNSLSCYYYSSPCQLISLSFRINKYQRVLFCVVEGIESSGQTYRITADVSSDRRVVVSVPVVMEGGFGIVILAGEAEVDGYGACGRAVAEGV